MQHDLAPVRPTAMFEQVETLPCAEHQPPGRDRNGQRNRRQRRLDMGRHIVQPLVAVNQIGHRRRIGIGNEPSEEGVEIAPHVGVGVLLNEQ